MPRYRVARGRHQDKGKVYYKGSPNGDIISLSSELAAKLNAGVVHKKKFVLVTGTAAAITDKVQDALEDGLENKTLNQLRALAEEEEIDLGEAKKKIEVIEIIREALTAVVE